MHTIEEIIKFVSEETSEKEVTENSDIEYDLGCTGDDYDEFMYKYSKVYNVDMSSYLWYFHHIEEGSNFGSIFFKAPNEIVDRIPVTPKLLLEFVEKGKWDLNYPEHELPKRRYDIIANQIFLLIIVIWIVYYWWK